MKRLGKAHSQIKDVLNYLRAHGSISSMEAFELFHITRLAAVIYNLRRYGFEIDTVDVGGINEYGPYTYALYTLVEAE